MSLISLTMICKPGSFRGYVAASRLGLTSQVFFLFFFTLSQCVCMWRQCVFHGKRPKSGLKVIHHVMFYTGLKILIKILILFSSRYVSPKETKLIQSSFWCQLHALVLVFLLLFSELERASMYGCAAGEIRLISEKLGAALIVTVGYDVGEY